MGRPELRPIQLTSWLILGTGLALCACVPSSPDEELPQIEPVPSDLAFEVLNPGRPEGLRCSPDLQISYKVPPGVLESLTRGLLLNEAIDCEFGVVTFYLPHMQPGGGAWAVAEYSPDITVSILGLGAADEKELVSRARSGKATIGTWIDDTSYAAVVSLVQAGGSYQVEYHLRDRGEPTRRDVVLSRYAGRPGFEDADDNGLGRYYVVNRRGFLETYDDHGRLSESRLFRLDRDVDRVVDESRERQRQRAVTATELAEEIVDEGNRRRLERWLGWLAVYRRSMEPVRHPVMRLAVVELEEERDRSCSLLLAGLEGVPGEVREVPTRAIDVNGLEITLSRVAAACQDRRWVGVLVEARAAAAFWRELDRSLSEVAEQYQQLARE